MKQKFLHIGVPSRAAGVSIAIPESILNNPHFIVREFLERRIEEHLNEITDLVIEAAWSNIECHTTPAEPPPSSSST